MTVSELLATEYDGIRFLVIGLTDMARVYDGRTSEDAFHAAIMECGHREVGSIEDAVRLLRLSTKRYKVKARINQRRYTEYANDIQATAEEESE